MNMKAWAESLRGMPVKKALPVLSFPSITLMGTDVLGLIGSDDMQAEGMKRIADRTPSLASVSMMDLSVEAEAFGSTVRFASGEVPTVIGSIINDEAQARALKVPNVGAGRTGRYISAINKAKKLITDRPVLAGVIGPFSLAGRMMDVTEALANCYDDPDFVLAALEKATEFLIEYVKAYREAGADGVVMAEPLTGLLSPKLAKEFSCDFVKRIIDAVRTDEFLFVYHNCGNNVVKQFADIYAMGADMYHVGNAVDIEELLKIAPSDALILGNVDPAGQFMRGTPESVKAATLSLMRKLCDKYPNFIISSGCDVPPLSPWENIDAFYEAVDEYNKGC